MICNSFGINLIPEILRFTLRCILHFDIKDILRIFVILMAVVRILHYNSTYFHYNSLILYELLCVRLIANAGNTVSNVRDSKIFVLVNLCVQMQTALILQIGTHTQPVQ